MSKSIEIPTQLFKGLTRYMYTTIHVLIEVAFDDHFGRGHISRFIKERNLRNSIIFYLVNILVDMQKEAIH